MVTITYKTKLHLQNHCFAQTIHQYMNTRVNRYSKAPSPQSWNHELEPAGHFLVVFIEGRKDDLAKEKLDEAQA